VLRRVRRLAGHSKHSAPAEELLAGDGDPMKAKHLKKIARRAPRFGILLQALFTEFLRPHRFFFHLFFIQLYIVVRVSGNPVEDMMEVIWLSLIVAIFVVMLAFVAGCERLLKIK
jgi:hypothetical protein